MQSNPPRVALVTGGSRGIGAGICIELLKAGYRVAIGYHRNADLAHAIAADYVNAMPVAIDIADATSVLRAFDAIEAAWGPVVVLVNNAAIAERKPFLELTDDDWERMLSVNLLGAVRCARRALPDMQARRFGRIINISSIGGQWGGVFQLHYAASKAALINLTRSLAKLYSAEGITANAIAPGFIRTEMSAPEIDTPEGQAKIAKDIPAQRVGLPEEIGAAVVYLASEGAAYVSGQTLNLNGGQYFG